MTTDTWVSLPDGSYPNYQVNRAGDVRTLDGELVPYHRPPSPDPNDDTYDTYRLDHKDIKNIAVGRYELIEAAFYLNDQE
jgi:hypothetical protein